jgi:hypothetical protein
MDKSELIQFTEQVTNTYDQLSSTIQEIGKLKDLIQQISIVSEDLQNVMKQVVNNAKLNEFRDQNQSVTAKLKVDIEKIDKDMGVLLSHRHQFVDFMETYKEMIVRFQSTAEEEVKVTNDLIKRVNIMTANLNMNQNKLNTNLQKANTIINSQEIVTNYQVLNKKLESMNDKINKIETLLVAKLK